VNGLLSDGIGVPFFEATRIRSHGEFQGLPVRHAVGFATCIRATENLVGQVAREPVVRTQFVGREAWVVSAQGKTPEERKIEAHELSPAVSGSAFVSQPLTLTRALPAIIPTWPSQPPITRSEMVRA